jgi:putative transposase
MADRRRGRPSVSSLTVHLVCVKKDRRKILAAEALAWLCRRATEVFAKMDCHALTCDGEADHLLLLIEYFPKLSVSVLVNAFKGTSSRLLRKERPDIARRHWRGTVWSPSYFAASSGGATLAVIRQYVEQQRASAAP